MCSGFAGPDAPDGLPDRQARRRLPVLPLHRRERARNRAVRGQADHDRHIAVGEVLTGDVAQAVGRIGQAVEKDRRARGRPVGESTYERFQSCANLPGWTGLPSK